MQRPAKIGREGRKNDSTEEFVDFLPLGPLALLLALFLNQSLDIQLPDARDQIHIVGAHDGSTEPEFVGEVECYGYGEREVHAEEALEAAGDGKLFHVDGGNGDIELRDKDEAVEEEADVGADDARLRAEGEFVEAMALGFPALAEADV